jgi:hypothetical protein
MTEITTEVRDQFESLQNQMFWWTDKENAIKEAKQRVFNKMTELSKECWSWVYAWVLDDGEKVLYPITTRMPDSFNPYRGDKFFFSLEEANAEGFVLYNK